MKEFLKKKRGIATIIVAAIAGGLYAAGIIDYETLMLLVSAG